MNRFLIALLICLATARSSFGQGVLSGTTIDLSAYPANPQKPITYINRARSTQMGGLIIFDDPVVFNGVLLGGTGGSISLTGTNGPIYIDQPNFRVAVGQDLFLGWNGNAELTLNASAANGNLNALIAHTQDNEGVPVIAWSQSGAPAFLATQDTHFDNPTFAVYRAGQTGDTTTTATMLVQSGQETTVATPVLQVGGCTALSGDNWYIVWGDGALSLPGGILDNPGKTKGHLAIDPIRRQLVAPDGITPVLTWSAGEGIAIKPSTAPASPAEGSIYYDSSSHHFFGWTGSAWHQLDN